MRSGGRLPVPTGIKALQGTLRKDRVNAREPEAKPLTRAPRPPEWLGPLGVAAWRRLWPVLLPVKVCTVADVEVVALAAHWLGIHEQCARALRDKPGLSFVVQDADGNPRGVQAWPETKLQQQAVVECRRLLEHLGLTPASRTRVSSLGPAADDPWDRFEDRGGVQ